MNLVFCLPKWRNRQTRQSQKLLEGNLCVGSSPTFGTKAIQFITDIDREPFVTQNEDRLIRGVLEEVAVVTTDKGCYKRLTIRQPRAVDEETGIIIQTLRSMYFSQVYLDGKPVSEVELSGMRGSRLEVHFLADNACQIRITK